METSTIRTTGKRADFTDIFTRCGERAAGYDQEQRFFQEDFEELRDAGYLLMPIPKEMGGYGMTMEEVMQQQRQLAYHAAPTALALNMHLYWMGSIADRALELSGGFGIFPASGMERLFRDARLGRIHPANTYLSREMIGKAILGIDWDEQPRWG